MCKGDQFTYGQLTPIPPPPFISYDSNSPVERFFGHVPPPQSNRRTSLELGIIEPRDKFNFFYYHVKF